MRVIFLSFLFSIPIHSFSQDDALLGDWYLHYYSLSGSLVNAPEAFQNFSPSLRFSYESVSDSYRVDGGSECFTYATNTNGTATGTLGFGLFSFLPIESCLDDRDIFEEPYVLNILDSNSCNYSISGTTLTVTNPDGDFAVLSRDPLTGPTLFGRWYIHQVTNAVGTNIVPPAGHDPSITFQATVNEITRFYDLQGVSVCNDFNGTYRIDSYAYQLPLHSLNSTNDPCPIADEFETALFDILMVGTTPNELMFNIDRTAEGEDTLLISLMSSMRVSSTPSTILLKRTQTLSTKSAEILNVNIVIDYTTEQLLFDNLPNDFFNYTIVSTAGQVLVKGVLNTDNISLTGYSKGIYFLKIESEKGSKTIKFVK
ncbi:T9SS type A sorting domain-containing protein [Sungkyunkwania multivorans]|uniref:T9SS type A sorting domain-containing protein n=1 Tax=Sungkyunkwania multivorans TaxID=1173618 RepID=A0ABW3CUR7_9FLAO